MKAQGMGSRGIAKTFGAMPVSCEELPDNTTLEVNVRHEHTRSSVIELLWCEPRQQRPLSGLAKASGLRASRVHSTRSIHQTTEARCKQDFRDRLARLGRAGVPHSLGTHSRSWVSSETTRWRGLGQLERPESSSPDVRRVFAGRCRKCWSRILRDWQCSTHHSR